MPPQSITPPTKPCRTCGETKPLEDFHRDRSRPDGRRNTCKECDALADKRPEVLARKRAYWHDGRGKEASQRYYHEGKGRETRKAYNDQPDVAEKRKERQPAYTAKFNQSEKGKAWWKAYRASPEFKEQQRERRQRPDVKERDRNYKRRYFHTPQYQAWYKEHSQLPEVQKHRRDYARIYVRARYSRKRALPATFTKQEWQHALEWFGNRCVYCGMSGRLAQEHIVPVSANGPYIAANIVPACQSCNASKRDKKMEEWATAEAVERIHTYLDHLTLNDC